MGPIILFAMVLSAPSVPAKRAAVDAAYKQSGTERVVASYIELMVPNNVKEIGRYALPISNALVNKSFTINFVF